MDDIDTLLMDLFLEDVKDAPIGTLRVIGVRIAQNETEYWPPNVIDEAFHSIEECKELVYKHGYATT
jgi:hypothetical protein